MDIIFEKWTMQQESIIRFKQLSLENSTIGLITLIILGLFEPILFQALLSSIALVITDTALTKVNCKVFKSNYILASKYLLCD